MKLKIGKTEDGKTVYAVPDPKLVIIDNELCNHRSLLSVLYLPCSQRTNNHSAEYPKEPDMTLPFAVDAFIAEEER